MFYVLKNHKGTIFLLIIQFNAALHSDNLNTFSKSIVSTVPTLMFLSEDFEIGDTV